ncbi:MAG: hypothetical protein JW724_02315 [Candidatus Altiarchaeota archaeon]|nr:hypothetical protein [Candidatus Altiarchaeota archaeon]
MGLYNIIKQKKGSKDQSGTNDGEHVSARTEEELEDFCKSLTEDFKGVMRLCGKNDERRYTAALLLEEGRITGASFEDLSDRKTVFRDEALDRIKKRLSGTCGDLEVYSFSRKGMDKVRKENKKTLLKSVIPFSELGMKIKSNIASGREGKNTDSFSIMGRGIKELDIKGTFSLVDFARAFPAESRERRAGDLKELENAAGHLESGEKSGSILGLIDPKSERLAELKKRRQMEDTALMKRISQITGRKEEKSPVESNKVETSIDRLYQLVDKYKRLKIDNTLSKKLGVSRAQIEGWAMILEEHNLVELHYPAIGEPEIRKSGFKG